MMHFLVVSCCFINTDGTGNREAGQTVNLVGRFPRILCIDVCLFMCVYECERQEKDDGERENKVQD